MLLVVPEFTISLSKRVSELNQYIDWRGYSFICDVMIALLSNSKGRISDLFSIKKKNIFSKYLK